MSKRMSRISKYAEITPETGLVERRKVYARRYREEHREELKKYREEHKEEMQIYLRKYNKTHKAKHDEYYRRYCEKNKEKLKAYNKRYYRSLADAKKKIDEIEKQKMESE
jgi:hypothetical protein